MSEEKLCDLPGQKKGLLLKKITSPQKSDVFNTDKDKFIDNQR